MAIDYATKYASKIDERFALASQTANAVNNDYDFVGTKTVKVYSIPTVGLVDYNRSGLNRYGTPSELQNSVQELTLGMDRSFTFSVDRGNYEDTQRANSAGLSLNRELTEQVIPEVDRYRLLKMAIGAGKIKTGAITSYYGEVLAANAELTEGKAPLTGRMLFVSPTAYSNIKLDSAFVSARDVRDNLSGNGVVGMIDGASVVVLPSTYMPFGAEMLMTHRVATVGAQKLAEYKVHDNPPGINGWLVEGRVYYDAFVLDNKKAAIYVVQSTAGAITITAEAGSSGKCLVTITSDILAAKAGAKIMYKAGASLTAPTLGADVSTWTEVTGSSFEFAGTAGHKVCVVYAIDGKAYAVSNLGTVALGA